VTETTVTEAAAAEAAQAGGSAPAAPASAAARLRGRSKTGGGRGRKQSRLFELRGELPRSWKWGLAALGLLAVLGLWLWTAATLKGEVDLVPTPAETWKALVDQWQKGNLWVDLKASTTRIFYGFGTSMIIGVIVGVALGSMASVEAAVEAPIAFLRYVPATAMTPLMLVWLGIDEAPKLTLIVVGTVFFNILMVADVARAVPRELIEASYTLGARRRTVLCRVVLRHSLPGIIDVARINLAAGWLVLVVAELLAAKEGLAFRIQTAERFRQTDTMFALLIVFGLIGIVSDLVLRWLRNASSPWARP
jgi:NitT/TauT family transport system permease protein